MAATDPGPAAREPFVRQPPIADALDRARRSRFPAGAAIEFADLEEHRRLGALDALRGREPVTWSPALGCWLVTGYDLVRCLGFNLARLQGSIALGALLDRLPGLRLVEAAEPAGFAFRKPARLVAAWAA